MLGLLIKGLLYREPKIQIIDEERLSYDTLMEHMRSSPATVIDYQLPYAKSRFLYYLCEQDEFILHGSNNTEIDEFQPREQTLFNGQLVKAIFATTDSIWPVFYATFDRSKLKYGMRNGCLEYKGRKYHFYSLSETTMQQTNIWTNGMIYILPRKLFRRSGSGAIMFDEWICEEAVTPIAKLPVSAHDFYYLYKVSTHKDRESLLATYLKYKWRTRWGRNSSMHGMNIDQG